MASNALANRRSVMNLFSSPKCPYCHRTRIVLAEKDIAFETIDVDVNKMPEDLSELNPYNTVPTLVDRDLVLYNASSTRGLNQSPNARTTSGSI